MTPISEDFQKKALITLVETYTTRDYARSELISEGLCPYLRVPAVAQIFMISAQRLGRSSIEINRRLGPLLSALVIDDWDCMLLKVTMGQESNVPKLLEFARTESQRCSLYYYLANRMVFAGYPDAANRAFVLSAESKVDSIERNFATIECETRGISLREVRFHLRERVHEACEKAAAHFKKGLYTEALPLAKAALQSAEREMGENFTSTCECLNTVGVTLMALGHRTDALPFFRRSLSIQRKVYTEKHPAVIHSLDHLATVCADIGDCESALDFRAQILKIRRTWRTSEAGDDSSLADALASYATHLRSMGRYQDARDALDEVLTMRRAIHGDEHEKSALAMGNLAMMLAELGDNLKARQHYERAIDILVRDGSNHPETAMFYNNYAALLATIGKHDEALFYCQKAYWILATVDPNDLSLAEIRLNLAQMLARNRDIEGALSHFEAALSVFDKKLGDHPRTAQCLSAFGAFSLHELGDCFKSRRYFERALAIQAKSVPQNHPHRARVLNDMGRLLEIIGDHPHARRCYEEALTIRRLALGDFHVKTAEVLSNLGILCRRSGDLESARRYEEESMRIRETILPRDHPDWPFYHAARGNVFRESGEIAKARDHFEQALILCRSVFGENHLYTAHSLRNLGLLSRDQGHQSEAKSYFTRALAMVTHVMGVDHPQRIPFLVDLALSYAYCGRPSEALGLMNEAAGIDDAMIGQVFALSSDSRREAYLLQIRLHFDITLHFASQRLPKSAQAIKMALDLVLRRKGLAADALVTQREAVWSGKYPQLQPQFKELLQLRALIGKSMLDGPGDRALGVYRSEIQEWRHRQEHLESALAQKIPEMNYAHKLRKTDSDAVALCLPEGSVLIEFIRFLDLAYETLDWITEPDVIPQRYLAFVVFAGAKGNHRMIDLGDASKIDQLAADFLMAITTCAPHSIWRRKGNQLRHAIFTEKLADILKESTRLILAPDSQLNLVPFEALSGDDDQLLVDEYEISYLNCGREVLRSAMAPGAETTPPLVVADPNVDLAMTTTDSTPPDPNTNAKIARDFDRKTRFKRLSATREEGKQIADLLHVKPLLDAEALASRVKSSRSPRLLHLATHGFFLRGSDRGAPNNLRSVAPIGLPEPNMLASFIENPMLRSGLALAGVNTWLQRGAMPGEAENGLLTAEDVSVMDLEHTELVVLSACETALGPIRAGEGVYGLRRAFAIAGAKTVVMSLWKVPDDNTRDLMIKFYSGLLKTGNVAEALHEAQLEVRQRFSHPFYWSAFICQGGIASIKDEVRKATVTQP